MRGLKFATQAFSVAVLYVSSIALTHAAVIPFFGTRDSFGGTPPAPSPPLCPGAAFLDIPSGPGNSNLGAFTHDDSHCVAMGTVYDGVFNWDFGQGDTMVGTFSGLIQAVDGVTTFDEAFVITGGSGRFMDASGSFNGIGAVTFTPDGANTHMDFEGSITIVPEPASFGLLLLCLPGFAALRRTVRPTPA